MRIDKPLKRGISRLLSRNAYLIRKDGFTIIELFLGLLIFSIVAMMLYSVFSTGLKIDRKTRNTGKILNEMRWSVHQMVLELENMLPFNFANSYPDKVAFEGQSDRVSFILASGKKNLDFKVISYYLQKPSYGKIRKTVIGQKNSKNVSIVSHYEQESAKTMWLVHEEKTFSEYLQDKSGEIEILSSSLKEGGLKFSYAFVEEGSQDIIWKEIWKEPHLPLGVRMELTFWNPENPNQDIPIERDVLIPIGSWGKKE